MWQQFSWLNPSVYSATLRDGCCVPPYVADVSNVLIARCVCNYINEDYYYYYYYYDDDDDDDEDDNVRNDYDGL